MNVLIKQLRKIVRSSGFDLVRYDPELSPIDHKRYIDVIKAGSYDAVFDIGANIGQFADSVLPFIDEQVDLISFEPMTKEYEILKKKAKASSFSNWVVYDRVAIGETEKIGKMKITQNSVSSSLLEIDANFEMSSEEGLIKIGEIETPVKSLDKVIPELGYKNIFLKADVQGYEESVLNGAQNSLKNIGAIHLEFSLIPHYEGQSEMSHLFTKVCDLGYYPILFLPHTTFNSNSELQQVDVVFRKKNK